MVRIIKRYNNYSFVPHTILILFVKNTLISYIYTISDPNTLY